MRNKLLVLTLLTLSYLSMNGQIDVERVSFDGMTPLSIQPRNSWGAVLGTQSNVYSGAYIWHIWGGIYDDWPSDKNAKKNIRYLNSALDKVMALKPVKYDIKEEIYKNIPQDKKERYLSDKYGFIAQEVKEIIPEIVHVEPNTGLYGLAKIDMIPFLVLAIQEQQEMIKDLQKTIKDTEQDTKNKTKSKSKSETLTNKNINAELFQNYPNPFNESTRIEFSIPENTSKAMIYIYNMQGLEIKNFRISEKGKSSINISGNELKPGMYLYTLIIDGIAVDTKQMILTSK